MHAALVHSQVQEMLTQDLGLRITLEGDVFRVAAGSGYTGVAVHKLDGEIVVRVYTSVLMDVHPTHKLYQYIAESHPLFGRFDLNKREDGNVDITLGHSLLGERLDPEELKAAIDGITRTADRLGYEMEARFGGHRFVDATA